ncbi:glycoside hydrolase family 15 protein [Streptomyces sp. CRN 30]|uniref:glycoside hydrolase family 15 protein n=1 Tax=Streptomyces sp. CRN 30 TaxID=3075613 RepID=UPI002A8300FE|nr:glycoside hydrolase family 15 protein [Streptomyces sp. CRN 30]
MAQAETAPPGRTDGYAELRSYAAIGDGYCVALVARDGDIDWYPAPDLDSPPVFGRLLDALGGGYIRLRPRGPYETEREYLPHTNVLRTTYRTPAGTVRVTDVLNVGLTGRLPWSELARRIEGVDGEVEMEWAVVPGNALNTVSPWAQHTDTGTIVQAGDVTLTVRLSEAGEVHQEERSVGGRLTTAPDSRHLLAVIVTRDGPVPLVDPDRVLEGIGRTVHRWEQWSAQLSHDGPWREAVLRSALALKLLIHSPTGAVAAAATTSLPESRDGGLNWDYRYAWIRDATYTLKTLLRLGEPEEAHGAVAWLLRLARRHDGELPVMARLDGGEPPGETYADVPGWRGIGPVVTGNRAAGQLQLGVYGDLLDIVRTYTEYGNVLDAASGRMLADLADRVCDLWHRPDSGMWELPEARHYTSSKMGCWHALDSAVALAESGQIPGSADRWRSERDLIRRWIDEHCWSAERGAYVWYPGTDRLDASVLLHAGSGFDRGERMSATIDALREELGAGPLLYRHGDAPGAEGTFTACAFWTVEALAWVGRGEEAEELMARLVPLANDVGLFTEMIDADDLSFLGNMPQGLSHLAVITAALALRSGPSGS